MTKYALAALAALMIVAVAPAQGDKMDKMHQGMHMGHGDKVQQTCMMGLSADEMKQAHMMMMHWSPSEQAAWHERCSLCMADPHKMLMKMEKEGKQPTMAQIHQHMMSGLSKSQQHGMEKIMADHKDHDLIMKMAENCCMYGAKHNH